MQVAMNDLAPRFDWVLGLIGCCSSATGRDTLAQNEVQVQLCTGFEGGPSMQHLTSADDFDITFTPGPFTARNGCNTPITPRQRCLKEGLELPELRTYPTPPNSGPDETEEERMKKLLEMYQEFALDLHTGTYLTQLTSNRDYSDIHCQLMEDMHTLKLDQSNGRIIEFPLTGVSKVYRIVKNDDKWYSAGAPMPGAVAANTEHIVVVEFMRRKLAFVFKELQASQRFLVCMELLIRRAQQKQSKKGVRSLKPAFPHQPAGAAQGAQASCPTPRQLQNAFLEQNDRSDQLNNNLK